MGIDVFAAAFLLEAKSMGIELGSTLMIGRQTLMPRKRARWPWSKSYGMPAAITDMMAESVQRDGHAETFFGNLGATQVASLDNSAYEGARFTHDLNYPIPAELNATFDTVYDGGSTEHIFNFPVALSNLMRMVKPGGHFMTVTIADSYAGHGFYQFSPEVFFRALAPENGYECLLVGLMDKSKLPKIIQMTDPKIAGRRFEFATRAPTYVVAIGRRTSDIIPFKAWPQQDFYETAWNAS
jgi:SAM-dependent methyltransferase